MRELALVKQLGRLENASALDPVIERVSTVVNAIFRPSGIRDLLHGVPLGHPLHPLMVQVPLGAWTSAAMLDLLPGTGAASTLLVGVGVVTALPAAAAGEVDWTDLHEQHKRVGLVHAAANVIGTSLYAASLVQRLRGRSGSGKMLSYLGLAVVSAGGFLGGHLSYRQAAGANHTEDVPHLFPAGWQVLGPVDSLAEGELTQVRVAGLDLLAVRRGSGVHVISNVCSHLSAPLSDGEIVTVKGEECVVCPWHGSKFSLKTGDVLSGPATAPAPRFDVRVTEGTVEVRLLNAG